MDLGEESRRVVLGFAEGEFTGAPGDLVGEVGDVAGQDQRFFLLGVEEADEADGIKEDKVEEVLELFTDEEAMLDPARDIGALWLRRSPSRVLR